MIGAPASGGGDREWGARLMQSVEATPNLRFLGRLPQSAVNHWLARSHLFVNTSNVEGFPNTFIQAWMREVPMLSLDINPEGVLDGQSTGLCAGSERNMAEFARRLLTTPALLRHMATAARRYANHKHSLANVQQLIALLDTAAA